MKALTFELHLLEPLLAARLGGGDPNSVIGFEFIPGSSIRGMVIALYTKLHTPDASNSTFRRLFLDGSVRFLNAYPQIQSKRALPTPLSWRLEKDKDEPILDFAVETVKRDVQWQKVKQPFCNIWQSDEDSCKAELCSPNHQIDIHTARENRQKSTKDESTVFRYEAIAPEQTFCGVILAEEEEDLQTLKQWLPAGGTVSLGGSHLAGYGQTRLDQVKIQHDWQEYTPVGDDTECIIVTLLSDALIRDPRTGANVVTLEPLLGLVHEEAFIETRIVSGFNRKWNLPLPQTQAIRAGSVFVYLRQPELLARLQDLMNTGIGERRAEGFGRIAINWHTVAEITPVKGTRPVSPLPFSLEDGTIKSLARQMVDRMLREQLDRELISVVNRFRITHPPKNAQLSRIRIVARQALSQKDPKIIINHLDGMKKAAKDQLQTARIGDVSLDDWLRGLAGNVPGIWQLIRVDRNPAVGGIEAELTDSLALEYTILLIERVLRKAQKEAVQ